MKTRLWLAGGSLMVSLSCSSILGPDRDLTHDTNWRTKASRHCVIYFHPASYAERDIDNVIRKADASYEKIVETLQIGYSGVISVYLYNTPQDAGWKSCDSQANPRTETIKYVYGLSCLPKIGPHEFDHVITWNALGEPGTMLLDEGFAEATEETWWGKAHHLWTRQFIEQNKLPSLKELSDNRKWFKFAGSVSYPTAGSFVKYLIETHDLDKAKTLFFKATHVPSRTCSSRSTESAWPKLKEIGKTTAWACSRESWSMGQPPAELRKSEAWDLKSGVSPGPKEVGHERDR